MTIDPEHIASKTQLLEFLAGLQADLKENPAEWENLTLDRYLEAVAAWIANYESYYRNSNQSLPVEPDWAFLQRFCQELASLNKYFQPRGSLLQN